MAPGTNLGAATPVQIGGPLPGLPGSAPDKDGKDKKDDAQQPALKDAMTAKATNDAVALIRSLAELRGRNADWAEKAVREAASLSASAALQMNVIDLVARNPRTASVDRRPHVELAGGDKRQLATKGLTIERLDPGWLIRLLSVITNPNVAFILLMVGIYGLIFELSTPGAIAPGVIGTICLLLGLYALNMLPINYTGLALLLLGIAFLIVEPSTRPWFSGLAALPRFFWEPPCCSRSRAPGTGCHGRYHHRGGDDLQPDRPRAWLALARPQKPGTGWGAGHGSVSPPKFSTGPAAKVTSSPMANVCRPRDGSSCARRDGRGGRYQGSDPCGAAAITTNRQRRRCVMMFDYLKLSFLVVVVVMFLAAAIRILRNMSAASSHTGSLHRGEGARSHHPHSVRAADGEGRSAGRGAGRAAPGRDSRATMSRSRSTRPLLPHRRPGASDKSRSRTLWPRPASWRKPRCAPVLGKHELDELLAERIGSTLTFRGASISRPTPGASGDQCRDQTCRF